MTTVTVSDVRTQFEQLLSRLAEEKEIVVTAHDQPVARIIPPEKTTKPKWPDFRARQRALFGDKVFPGNAVAEMRAL